jgi:beta-lactamase class A
VSVWKPIRNLAIIVLLLAFSVIILSIAIPGDSPDELADVNDEPEVVEPTPTPEDVALEPTPAPTPEPTPTPDPSPRPPPEPTATPPPEPTPTPVPSPTPESTPVPRDPPFPVACNIDDPVDDPELEAVIRDVLGAQEANFGVVVQELTSGVRAEVNPDQSFYGASLFKTGIMYELLRQVDEGTLDLNQYVTIDSYYAQRDLGTLGILGWTVGTQVTLAEALKAMITVSDNATAILLGDLVGWSNMDRTLAAIGAEDTLFSSLDLPTTAGDTAIILSAITCSTEVEEESSQLMLDVLAGQTVTNRLPRDLPAGTVVAHKTGNWTDANHDTGIVYGPDATYVIAVLSRSPGADATIIRLSRAVYDYFHASEPADDGNDGD